jgi:uncharacterized protein YbjT (DUF2867 family)
VNAPVPTPPPRDPGLILVTGATGYIGGRLIPELLGRGFAVRVLARHPERLRDHPWIDDVEVVAGDAADPAALDRAMAGVGTAYYLLHSLGSGPDFERTEATIASTFADAAHRHAVGRIVYLGGLSHDPELSPHMRSRAEVARILLDAPVPAIVLKAAVIIGSGSLSFEMLRYLTERLPAMVTPKWVKTRVQPIAIRDVLRYLVEAAIVPEALNRSFDIAGPEILTYEDMMQRYAAVAGLRPRIIVGVPVLTPKLSSRWVGLVTPLPSSVAKPLVGSLRNEAVAREHDIDRFIADPAEGLLGFDRAVELALVRVKEADVATRWSSASVAGAPSDPLPTDPDWAGGSLYTDERSSPVNASPEDLWAVIESIGGDNGWYSLPLAWEIRGLMDRAIGGVGLRRGRRDAERLMVGETVDFWRVEERVPDHLLRLRAEMKLPGLAWLELRVERDEHGGTVYAQRALFHPRGLAGHAYWWSVAPFHGVVFGSMVRSIAAAAEQRASGRAGADHSEVTGR